MPVLNKNASLRYGFTLIELSIVLVIIGLLAGGILVGRDLIRAAEIQRQVKQLQEYQLAFTTFKTKYNCIPGDCATATDYFGAAVVNGNGNGLVDTSNRQSFDPNTVNTWLNSPEIPQSIHQLSLANMINFKPQSTTTHRVGLDLPPLTLNNNASFFMGANYNFIDASGRGSEGPPADLLTAYQKGNNALWLVACATDVHDEIGYWNDSCGVFKAADLQAVDLKIDDGKALSGHLLGFGGDNTFSDNNTNCLANFEYQVLTNTIECQAVFVIN